MTPTRNGADGAQHPVPALEPEILDVGSARLAHPKTLEAEQHGERCVGAVELLGG
jgi:hypothetical protein